VNLDPKPVFQISLTQLSDGRLTFEATALDLVRIYGLLESGKDIARGMVATAEAASESRLHLPR